MDCRWGERGGELEVEKIVAELTCVQPHHKPVRMMFLEVMMVSGVCVSVREYHSPELKYMIPVWKNNTIEKNVR